MNEPRGPEGLFRLTIVAVSAIGFLFLLAVSISIGFLRFDWSDRLLDRWTYERGKASARRILVLGDSQLAWWNLDHCLSEDIRRFGRRHDIGVVVASKGGFGPLEYLNNLWVIGPDYRPDVVLLFYYAGNDLTDVMYRPDLTPKALDYGWVRQLEITDETFAAARENDPFSSERADLSERRKQEILRKSAFDWDGFARHGVDPTIIGYARNRMYYPGKIGPEYVNPHILVVGTWKPDYLYANNAISSPESREAWSPAVAAGRRTAAGCRCRSSMPRQPRGSFGTR